MRSISFIPTLILYITHRQHYVCEGRHVMPITTKKNVTYVTN